MLTHGHPLIKAKPQLRSLLASPGDCRGRRPRWAAAARAGGSTAHPARRCPHRPAARTDAAPVGPACPTL